MHQPPVRTLLCYGDSNTWGYDSEANAGAPYSQRHPPETRWPGVLARELGPQWRVIEEGLNGRTSVFRDPFSPWRTGSDHLPVALESHAPLDLVILMLGTNDLKSIFAAPASEIAAGAALLGQTILRSTAGPRSRPPKLLLIAPPAVGNLAHLPDLDEKFGSPEARSRRFPELYRRAAATLGCAFLDAQSFTSPSLADGVHLDGASHAALGRAVAEAVRTL